MANKQRGGKRDGAGAKPLHTKPMRRVNVMLDEETIAKAELIGDGNLSAGLRSAVKRIRKPAGA
jgi:hypothetical protein